MSRVFNVVCGCVASTCCSLFGALIAFCAAVSDDQRSPCHQGYPNHDGCDPNHDERLPEKWALGGGIIGFSAPIVLITLCLVKDYINRRNHEENLALLNSNHQKSDTKTLKKMGTFPDGNLPVVLEAGLSSIELRQFSN